MRNFLIATAAALATLFVPVAASAQDFPDIDHARGALCQLEEPEKALLCRSQFHNLQARMLEFQARMALEQTKLRQEYSTLVLRYEVMQDRQK